MIISKKVFSILVFALFSVSLIAQQTSKSKSKDKLYEKGEDEEGREVILKNVAAINSEHLEFSPAFYQNGIVFISNRSQTGNIDRKINEFFFSLYYAELNDNGMPTTPEEFSIMINSGVHEGPVTFSKGGDMMYFTRSNIKDGQVKFDKKDKNHLKIYEAKKGAEDWGAVSELPFASDDYTTAHPSLSSDGNTLFFASDMEGGYGGMDLYKVVKKGGFWGEPINLGETINTAENEVFPFIHESNTLFFTSRGHTGKGGLDLFKSEWKNDAWAKVQNMGEPFNSPDDDLGLIMNSKGNKGFFTSSRPRGMGKDDIYQFELKESYEPVGQIPATFMVYDPSNSQAIDGASIRIFERAANGMIEGNDIYDVVLMPAKEGSGELVMKLVRKGSADMGEPDLVSNTDGMGQIELKPEQRYIFLVTKDGYENKELPYTTVAKNGAQTINVELSSQSCAPLALRVNNEKNNSSISDVRLLLENNCTGERVELKANAAGKLEYCIPPNCVFTITAQKEGYVKAMKTITASNSSQSYGLDINMTPIAQPVAPIAAGTVIVLENIYYDFNKSSIRSGAARELDGLVELMQQHPSMEVELFSHTDSRGGTRYNMQLSKKRAASAKRYIVSRGIDSQRITAIGKGETEPRNHCTDGKKCSEDEFQYNRRTEVKVVRIDKSVKVQYRN